MPDKNTFGKITLYRFEDGPASGAEPLCFDGFEPVKWGEETVPNCDVSHYLGQSLNNRKNDNESEGTPREVTNDESGAGCVLLPRRGGIAG